MGFDGFADREMPCAQRDTAAWETPGGAEAGGGKAKEAAGNARAESGSAKLSLLARRLGSLQPGIMTSLIGAPFFMLLLLRQNSGVRP